MATALGIHKERQAREAARELEIASVLAHRGKKLDALKRENKQKKKSVPELLARLDIDNIRSLACQDANDYRSRSYNMDRQIHGLIRHMFARYPVPDFLCEACIGLPKNVRRTNRLEETRRCEYRQWLVTVGLGGSFAQAVKGTMTRKEAHLFLCAPPHHTILQNVWWARMKSADIPSGTIEKLLEKPFGTLDFADPDGRLADCIRFYSRFHGEMDRVTFSEVTDFIAWKITNDPSFRMAGRTAASVIKLSNEWHRQIQKAKIESHVTWPGFGIPNWQRVTKDLVWEVTELRDNTELMREGSKQRHCVYSYVDYCRAGRSSIFSVRGYTKAFSHYDENKEVVWAKIHEVNRVTIEVRYDRTIVQARGPLNRSLSDIEKDVLKVWAGEKGFTSARL